MATGRFQKESLHGVGTMVDPDKIENCKNAACRVVTKNNGAGSGVLVDGRSVDFPYACLLTNEHVIGTVEQAASSTLYFNYKNDDSSKWLKAKLDPDLAFLPQKELDACLVALKTSSIPRLKKLRTLDDVENDDETPHCPAPVSLDPEAAASIKKGDPVTIWQHPGARGHKKMAQWKVSRVADTTLQYINDTSKGSSGSPVYNSDGDLIGIHCAGGRKANQGIRLSAILSWLEGASVSGEVTSPKIKESYHAAAPPKPPLTKKRNDVAATTVEASNGAAAAVDPVPKSPPGGKQMTSVEKVKAEGIESLSVDEVGQLMTELGLGFCVDPLREEEVDGTELKEFEKDDFVDLMKDHGIRRTKGRKIWRKIKDLLVTPVKGAEQSHAHNAAPKRDDVAAPAPTPAPVPAPAPAPPMLTTVYIEEGTTKYPFSGHLVQCEYGTFLEDGTPISSINPSIQISKEFVVNNNSMGGDPLVNHKKWLKLTFLGDATCKIPDGGWVTAMKGRVKKAEWGDDIFKKRVPLRSSNIQATNDWLGIDPCRGKRKTLVITYTH